MKVYVLTPLIALIIFAFYYMGFAKEYEAAEVAKVEAVKQARRDALIQEAADREAAIKDALAMNAQRRVQRELTESAELTEKEARQAASEANDFARSERNKFSSQVDKLKQDIETVKKEMVSIAEEKKRLAGEIDFLRTYVTAANSNVSSLQTVLQRINEADAARAAAEAAAAATAAAARR